MSNAVFMFLLLHEGYIVQYTEVVIGGGLSAIGVQQLVWFLSKLQRGTVIHLV